MISRHRILALGAAALVAFGLSAKASPNGGTTVMVLGASLAAIELLRRTLQKPKLLLSTF